MRVVLDLNRLQVFREVVLAGSFSKAALQLRQPKSRVSRNISALEKELGVQLIYRTTRQFQLTQAGTDLFRKAAPLLNEIGHTLDQLSTQSDEVAGPLKVTVPDDIGSELMGRLCSEFLALYPKVQMTLIATNQYMDLIKDSVDVAIRVGRSKDSSMLKKNIGQVQMAFVINPKVLTRSLNRVEDLELLPFLAFCVPEPLKPTVRVYRGKEARSLKLRSIFTSNNFFILRTMAQEGRGLALLPRFLVKEALHSGQLVEVFRDWKTESYPIQILLPRQKEVPQRIRKFIEFMTSHLSLFSEV